MIVLALLKGINLGPKNKISMKVLSSLLINNGFSHVSTYINTGNVFLETKNDIFQLGTELEQIIQTNLNLSIPVVVRTLQELKELIQSCPYNDEEIDKVSENNDYECFYVAFLSSEPTLSQIEKFNTYKNELEDYVIIKNNLYLLLKCSVRDSKLVRNLTKLDKNATVRNWNTVLKLREIVLNLDSKK